MQHGRVVVNVSGPAFHSVPGQLLRGGCETSVDLSRVDTEMDEVRNEHDCGEGQCKEGSVNRGGAAHHGHRCQPAAPPGCTASSACPDGRTRVLSPAASRRSFKRASSELEVGLSAKHRQAVTGGRMIGGRAPAQPRRASLAGQPQAPSPAGSRRWPCSSATAVCLDGSGPAPWPGRGTAPRTAARPLGCAHCTIMLLATVATSYFTRYRPGYGLPLCSPIMSASHLRLRNYD